MVPFTIACGRCFFCSRDLWSPCDNSNPNAWMLEKLYGYSGSGLFGYSHMIGGYAGGQAEYVRVPFADVGPLQIPDHLPDEKVLFLSDIFPTGYMAAENCNIQPGDTVAVWGCGPVGQFAIKSACLLGAGRVSSPSTASPSGCAWPPTTARRKRSTSTTSACSTRLTEADRRAAARTRASTPSASRRTAPARSTRGTTRSRPAPFLATDRASALRQAIQACRKGGTVSIPGVYGGFLDKVPIGAAFAKGLTLKMGQTHVHKYLKPLLDRIERGEIDPSFVITHRIALDDVPAAYQTFKRKEDNCIKVVIKP